MYSIFDVMRWTLCPSLTLFSGLGHLVLALFGPSIMSALELDYGKDSASHVATSLDKNIQSSRRTIQISLNNYIIYTISYII